MTKPQHLTAADLELWQLWQQGVDSDAPTLPRKWAHFPKGTPRVDVWTWFDRQFSQGLLRTIEIMQPTLNTTYSLAIRAWVHTPVEPTVQIDLFSSSSTDDWGAPVQKKLERQDRLF